MIKQLLENLQAKQAKMDKVLAQAGENLDFSKVTELGADEGTKLKNFRALNDECSVAMKAIEEYRETEKLAGEAKKRGEVARNFKMPGSGAEGKGGKEAKEYASLGDALIEHKFHLLENRGKEIEIPGLSLKTLMDEVTNGWVPQSLRTGKLVDKAVRPIQVIDLIPAGQTDMIAVKYMQEDTLDESNVAETDEAAQYGEAAFDYSEQSSLVRKIAVFLPVTDEQLEDVSQVRGLINNRLPAMIMRRLDSQLVNGTGAGVNLRGMLNTVGIQTYARAAVAADAAVDALRRAMTLIHTGAFAIPNGVLMNPVDWEGIRLMKTIHGAYIWGHPSEGGLDRVWGLPLAQCDSIAVKRAIVADFQQTELAEKRGISVLTSNSHSDFFIKGKQAVRADGRWAFIVYRPAAIVSVDLT